jgi:hypothetical protein
VTDMLKSGHRWLAPAALGVALGFGLVRGTAAQAPPGHPSAIVSGTCATPGAVTVQLGDVGAGTLDPNAPVASGLTPDSGATIPVDVGVTTVPMALADLVASDSALTVASGAGTSTDTIACGNLGTTLVGSDLVVGLQAVNGSNSSGIAWLHGDGNQTKVTVFLAQDLSTGGGERDGNEGANGQDDGASEGTEASGD